MAEQSGRVSSIHDFPVSLASLFFIKDLDRYKTEKPYRWAGLLDPSQEHLRTNIVLETRDNIPVRDVRESIASNSLSLEHNGFQIVPHCSQFAASLKEHDVLGNYLQETAGLLKNLLSAELTVCYSFKFRKSSVSQLMDIESCAPEVAGIAETPDLPIWPVHIDFTEKAGMARVQQTLTESETRLYLNGDYRIRIVNTWRPLYRPVENAPLSFCDPKTVVKEDLLSVDRPTLTQVSESYYLKYKPHQQYYWCSYQAPNEISFFTSWDSDPGESPPFCPHAAFRLSSSGSSNVVRESIETRTVVVTKKHG